MPYRYRGRGQFSTGTSRSGRGYTYAGRSVRINDGPLRLTWNGPQVLQEVFNAVVEAFEQVSDEALNYMQSVVPVRTGNLRDSCFVNIRLDGTRLQVRIGASAYYAVYVELGTSRTPAQPYIRPTFDFVIRILPGVINNEVNRRGR